MSQKPIVVVQKFNVLSRMLFEDLSPPERARMNDSCLSDRVEVIMAEEPDVLARSIPGASFLITENQPLSPALLGSARPLRLIQNGGLRHDAIDLDAVRRAGIVVAATALPTDIGAAEHSFALMMALGRKLLEADRSTRKGEGRSRIAPFVTTTNLSFLYRKTLGIVGLGEIGAHVARRAIAFGMRVIYFSRHRHCAAEEAALSVEYRTLHDLLAESDIVTVHVTRTPSTVGLVGVEEIALMKRSAFLINTSGGEVVHQDALTSALADRRIAGAGLDVFREEPLPEGDELTRLDNVVLTPHVAARGGTAFETVAAVFANIRRSLDGLPLEDVVSV